MTDRKAELERRLEVGFDYEGTMDYAEHVEGDAARSEAYRDEIAFLTELLKTPAERPVTDELLEEYGFMDDEPGYWFLEDEDGRLLMDGIRVEQNLRNQSEWRLFIETEENGAQTFDLKGFDHLLSLLEENGITFSNEDGEEGENEE
ncbi:hypothetical protein [Spirosoma rhododendri]|uniref:Uncharacterized protein n=1 Tax=Spirosoma rhododendri TaxID=2728024 RepID=A0A7L5DSH5_9BACT|nr:hypothetical protein [Spirosoma rhododendri]QJD79518.1 hypothetical protein HH216_14700 [Spirosoma rhododendri]